MPPLSNSIQVRSSGFSRQRLTNFSLRRPLPRHSASTSPAPPIAYYISPSTSPPSVPVALPFHTTDHPSHATATVPRASLRPHENPRPYPSHPSAQKSRAPSPLPFFQPALH